MRKFKALIPLLLATALLAGCADKGLPKPSGDGSITSPWVDFNIPMTELNFDEEEMSLSIYKGETHQYEYSYLPLNATISQLKWESDDESVASISESGLLTANKGGHATITVSSSADVPWQPKKLDVDVLIALESFEFDETDLDLDYNETYELVPTFYPEDASDKTLNYTSSDSSIATVINGNVTAKANTGECVITVTSNQLLGFSREINVSVSDKTIHVDSVEVELPEDTLEVGKQMTAEATVTPSDAKEYLEHGVLFETTTPDLIDIDGETGVIIAKEPGTAKIIASCEGVDSEEAELEIFEIVPDSLVLTNSQGSVISSTTINMSNDEGEDTYQLSYKYLDDESTEVTPSRTSLEYQVLNNEVLTVSENGLLTIKNSGETDVVLRDNQHEIGTSVHVVVTINAVSVTLQTEGTTLGIGKTMTLRSSITPSNVTDGSVTYSIDSTDYATLTQESGSTTAVLTGVAKGNVEVTVTTSNGVKDSKTISVEKIPGKFKEGTPYVVGSADFSSGTSTGSDASWDDADLAYEIKDDIVDPLYTVQKLAKVTFRANDQWKVRLGSTYLENSHYERTGGNAFDAGYMAFDSETTNVKVLEAGRYDIYYKIYADTGYEAVYIKKSAPLSIDKTLIYLTPSDTETINASNVAGTLSAVSDDTGVATVALNDNVITVTAVAEGDATVTVSDDLYSLTCAVSVSATPVTTHNVTYYLPDSGDSSQTTFVSDVIPVAENSNLYDALQGVTDDILGFEFDSWYESASHFRTDDTDNDQISDDVTVTSDLTIYAKYVKDNTLYYFNNSDEKDYYLTSSFTEYGIYASSVYVGTQIYSVRGVEGVEIQLGSASGVYKLTRNTSDWTILRKVSFGINDVSSWWSTGAYNHIYCFGADGSEWISNISFTDNIYTGFFDLKYNGFILTRSDSATGGWSGNVWNQTVDIKLDVAGENGVIYCVEHTTAFIQDGKDGSGHNYTNWW